jgi:hypothetical protein
MKLRLDIVNDYCKEKIYYKDLKKTADKLVELLENDSEKKLRYRIMFGTDWPMTEMEVLGVPKYNAAMFVLLQLVTRNLKNEKKFDAWHQFVVINPLRFLGVLSGEDKDDEFTVSMDKFEKMKDALLKLNEKAFSRDGTYDENIPKLFMLDNEGAIEKEINKAFNALEKRMEVLEIPAAHLIKSGGKFLLIGE